MKEIVRLIMAAMAATLVAGIGKAYAADLGTGNHSRSAGAAMSSASSMSAATPSYGTFEYEEALETGNLPSSDGRAADPATMGKTGERIPVIEAGGLKYRVGIDTQ